MLKGAKLAVLLSGCCLLLIAPAAPTAAQDGEGACPALVQAALQAAGEMCAGLNRDEACYGNNRVDATFWQARDDLAFSLPSDRVPLLDLQSIATAPLDLDSELWGVAVLNVRANLPETMPGQAVTFLLMGDTVLENAVPPDEAAPPVNPVTAAVDAPANLRSRPSANANVLGSVPAGTELPFVGVSEAGDWYEVIMDSGGRAWVAAELVDPESDLDSLPVTYGPNVPPRYAPMQAFYLTTGLGESACREAADALVVQSPEGVPVALNVNGLNLQIGSTVILTTAQGSIAVDIADSQDTVLVVTLVEGDLSMGLPGGPTIRLNMGGESLAVTLNGDGLADLDSEIVALQTPEAIVEIVTQAYQNAIDGGLIQDPGVPVEDLDVTFYEPPETFPLPPGMGDNVPDLESCGDGACDPALGENTFTCLADCPVQGCGNGVCEPSEDAASCPADCGGTTPCGNAICDADESTFTCPVDCPLTTCGDAVCDPAAGENPFTCPADCTGGDLCGDTFCDGALGETAFTCPVDCADGDLCGDAVCDPAAGENTFTCPADCAGGELCGDTFCDGALGEDAFTCPADCTGLCGNGLCEPPHGETTDTCPGDCPPPPPFCGNGQCEAGEDMVNCAGDCGGMPASICGNEIIELGEMCDDGNTLPNDGCSPTCMYE